MSASLHRTEAIAAGWASVRFIVGLVFSLFGAPTELLGFALMPRRWRGEFLALMRPAEQLVRRLLLIRAAELAPAIAVEALRPAAPRRKPRANRARPQRVTPPHASDQWRGVGFALWMPPRGRRLRRPRSATQFGAIEVARTRLFAERLEVLIRVVHAPEPAALRLARRLLRARARDPEADPVGRVLRPTVDAPENPARLAMKQLAPMTDEADRFFSSA